MATRVIQASFGPPPEDMIPMEGQPCLRDGVLFEVVGLKLQDWAEGLLVGVRPHGARRGSKVTTMRISSWRHLFQIPNPPG